ncbi:MAG: hypothetical protein ABH804_00125 [archaeon]
MKYICGIFNEECPENEELKKRCAANEPIICEYFNKRLKTRFDDELDLPLIPFILSLLYAERTFGGRKNDKRN